MKANLRNNGEFVSIQRGPMINQHYLQYQKYSDPDLWHLLNVKADLMIILQSHYDVFTGTNTFSQISTPIVYDTFHEIFHFATHTLMDKFHVKNT